MFVWWNGKQKESSFENVLKLLKDALILPVRPMNPPLVMVDPNLTPNLGGQDLTIQSVKSSDFKHLGSYGQLEVRDNDCNRLNGSAVIWLTPTS